MISPEIKKEFEKSLLSLIVKHSTDNPRQKFFRACVSFWEKKYPKEFEIWKLILAKRREGLKTQFAEWDKKGTPLETRLFFSLPIGLFNLIEETLSIMEKNPEFKEVARPFYEQDEINWFWREFPQYRIANKI